MTALRTGLTTGTCAAAAAKAAACALCGGAPPAAVEISLPGGQIVAVAVASSRLADDSTKAVASVIKDAGDDPDVTHGLHIVATVSFASEGDVIFRAGPGVGTITRPGLQLPPGEPAINPVPRGMIRAAVRQITDRPLIIEISIPGGDEIARRTFNPRLGIDGGLSILGTTGIVRPYCTKALRDALKCSLDVASACGVTAPALVPGNIGAKAARSLFDLHDQQLIEVSNEWGFIFDQLTHYSFGALLVVGHPGKLAKFVAGEWDTHSARSSSATAIVQSIAAQTLGAAPVPVPTVEGIFAAIDEAQRRRVGDALARRIIEAVERRLDARKMTVAVCLVDMAGRCLGCAGDVSQWRRQTEAL